MSEDKNQIIQALVKAQSAFKHAKKDSTNPHFRKKFSSYEAVLEACIEPLNKNNLFLSQGTIIHESNLICVTKITHISGEFIESQMPVLNTAGTPQGLGSALSYARRYALTSLLGIASGEDDDGELAQDRKPTFASAPTTAPHPGTDFNFGANDPLDKALKQQFLHKHLFKPSKVDPSQEICFVILPNGKPCGEKKPKP